jgi:hypothetical protein
MVKEGCIIADQCAEGSDGVKLWDVKACTQLVSPRQGHVVRGPTSCILWLTRRNEAGETLCYGTGLGYVVIWRQNSRDVSANVSGLRFWSDTTSGPL